MGSSIMNNFRDWAGVDTSEKMNKFELAFMYIGGFVLFSSLVVLLALWTAP